jgi:hypothetical protein
VNTLFCKIRKKSIVVTPEEKVRQKLIAWLMQTRAIPEMNFQLERTIKEEGVLRADILVRKKNDWWLLVECKRPEEKYREEHLDQILRYLRHWPSQYVMWSNGLEIRLWKSNNSGGAIEEVVELPKFEEKAI